MVIRFTKFTEHSNVQHHEGDTLLIPDEYAQVHVDDGNAVEVPLEEFEAAHRAQSNSVAPAAPAAPKAAKGKKKGQR